MIVGVIVMLRLSSSLFVGDDGELVDSRSSSSAAFLRERVKNPEGISLETRLRRCLRGFLLIPYNEGSAWWIA